MISPNRRFARLSAPVLVSATALFLMVINCTVAISKTSITSDEVVHIPAGFYALTTGEYRMNAEHPPLAKMWSAIPLFFLLPHDKGPSEPTGYFAQRGAAFYGHFWKLHEKRFREIWFWSRLSMIAFTAGLGMLLFWTTRRWFGTMPAVFATLIYAFEPNVLGHGRLVHTDVAASFMYLLFFVALYGYKESPTLLRACLLGLTTSLALVTKFSMVVLLPVLSVLFVLLLWKHRREPKEFRMTAGHALLTVIVIILIIQSVYGFQNHPLGADATWIQGVSRYPTLVVRTIEALSPVFPRDFLFGTYVVLMHNSGGHSSSLLGQYDYRGWWYYFPVAFALKTPIAFLVLAAAGILWSLWLLSRKETVFLLPWIPLAIYAGLAMSSGINIGIRHFMPAFPFLMMFAGVIVARIYGQAGKWGRIVAASVIGILALEAYLAFPYYISYFNQFKGANPGWRYLSDSNVEWGDAVPELVEYLKARNIRQVSGALLGGNMTLHFYGIEFTDIYEPLAKTRHVALGASFLNGSTVGYGDAASGRGTEAERVNFFRAYRARKPVAVFGNSIYLFDNGLE
jgi:4-amino-4-deoxy-L-arabinose transferase-like glycosyltransferase